MAKARLYCYIVILLYCYIAILLYCYIVILLYCYANPGLSLGKRSVWAPPSHHDLARRARMSLENRAEVRIQAQRAGIKSRPLGSLPVYIAARWAAGLWFPVFSTLCSMAQDAGHWRQGVAERGSIQASHPLTEHGSETAAMPSHRVAHPVGLPISHPLTHGMNTGRWPS